MFKIALNIWKEKVSSSKQISHWQYLVKEEIEFMLSFLFFFFEGPNT